jgi:hypothetical protein
VSAIFPYTDIRAGLRWNNFHGTLRDRTIGLYCIPDPPNPALPAARRMARHGAAIAAIVDHCLAENKRLRVLGARWSLSNIIAPDEVAIDPANLNIVLRVKDTLLTPAYKARRRRGYAPIFAQCGTHVAQLNRQLGGLGLALQTSGASDGHRIAGCIATGTHGSALRIGAVHDTVLAIHLVLSSRRSVLVQPAAADFTPELAAWLARETGIPTEDVRDDELFAAALVSLGSLGLVHGVILEAAPLYRLGGRQLARPFADPEVWRAISSLDTSALFPGHKTTPYHFEVVMNPYPRRDGPGAYVRALWKQAHGPGAPAPVAPSGLDGTSDLMCFLGGLSQLLTGPGGGAMIEGVIDRELKRRYPTADLPARAPGAVFGPSSLVPGHGTSTEIIVDHRHAHRAVAAIYRVLSSGANNGEHLLGAVALRFVPRTRALLGGNIHAMNCYIEMPSVRNREVEAVFTRCWQALERDGIPFACHWGQRHGMTPARLGA